MKYSWAEVVTGAAVLALAAVFGFYIWQATIEINDDAYVLEAEFLSAQGIRMGGDVRMAGVKIGRVGDMQLNPENHMAHLKLLINNDIRVPADSEVKISNESVLGGSFLEIVPGSDIVSLNEGDQFVYASGSVSLLSLLAGLVTQNKSEE